MPAGKPSIVAPFTGEREVAIAISNIRERIEAIEAELTGVDRKALAALNLSSSAGVDAALREIESLRRRVRALELGAPVIVLVEGQLIGVRNAIDFRAVGPEVQITGEATTDRVIVTVRVGSVVVAAEPAQIGVGGMEATFVP